MKNGCKYLDEPIANLMSDEKTAPIMKKWLEPWLQEETRLSIEYFYKSSATVNDLMANMGGGVPFKVLNGIRQELIALDELKELPAR